MGLVLVWPCRCKCRVVALGGAATRAAVRRTGAGIPAWSEAAARAAAAAAGRMHSGSRSALVAECHSDEGPGAGVDAAAADCALSGASVARPPVSASQIAVHVPVRFECAVQVAPLGAGAARVRGGFAWAEGPAASSGSGSKG
jgi:hypothetical protein